MNYIYFDAGSVFLQCFNNKTEKAQTLAKTKGTAPFPFVVVSYSLCNLEDRFERLIFAYTELFILQKMEFENDMA